MSWKDNLIQASYRGVNFQVDSSEYETGRRTELKQFAGQDSPSLQDFGSDATTISLTGYIISNLDNDFDYFAERDELIEAYNTIGVGELVHPYYGSMEVYPIDKIRVGETISEGGIARITMRFVRVNEEEQKLVLPSNKNQPPNITQTGLPIDSEDFNATVDAAIVTADLDAADTFANTFSAARGAIDNLKDSIVDSIQNIQQTIFKVKGTISSVIATATGTLSTIVSTIDNIINSPCSLFASFKSAAGTLGLLCGIGQGGIFGGSAGICSGVLRGETTELDGESIPNELGTSVITEGLATMEFLDDANIPFIPDAQLNNIIGSTDGFKYNLLTTMMRVAIRTEFLDQSQMITFADNIAVSIENFLERLGGEIDNSGYEDIDGEFIDNTLLFQAVEDLRNIFIQSMHTKASQLSTLTEYSVGNQDISALTLAYDKYEDLGREDEIYDMNRLEIRHPGFLPTGKSVRILDE